MCSHTRRGNTFKCFATGQKPGAYLPRSATMSRMEIDAKIAGGSVNEQARVEKGTEQARK